MRHLPVHWSEGMFLRPHHFQAADRYWAETTQTSEQWDHPYHYGVRHLEISREAIANYQFQVNLCQARLRDGTLLTLEAGAESDRVDLKNSLVGLNQALIGLEEAFEAQSVVRVYLGVPKLKLGTANTSTAGEPARLRYREESQLLPDENAGGNDQEVSLRTANVRLLLSTEDVSGYELLPIAQVQRAGESSPTPQLDAKYFPPLLAVEAWQTLSRDVIRAIYDLIGKKIEVLSDQVASRGIGFESQEPGDSDRLFMLAALNEAYATLSVMTFARGVHPYDAYRELCRIVGRLSIFGEDRRVPEVPRYDHDELAPIFYWVKERIEALLNRIRDYEYEQRYFVGVGQGMQVTLEPRWFHSDWKWFVGVARGALSAKECETLLTASFLDWKLGSSRQVEMLFKNRAAGLHLATLERPPRALPARDWLYFQVSRDNAAWRDVQETQTLAMRFKDELIGNPDTLPGRRQLVVKIPNTGRQIGLEFALFAVPERA